MPFHVKLLILISPNLLLCSKALTAQGIVEANHTRIYCSHPPQKLLSILNSHLTPLLEFQITVKPTTILSQPVHNRHSSSMLAQAQQNKRSQVSIWDWQNLVLSLFHDDSTKQMDVSLFAWVEMERRWRPHMILEAPRAFGQVHCFTNFGVD